jgi:putative endopeptidase
MARPGIETRWSDPSTRPADDLYWHVNGRWLADHEIPPDRSSDGAFRELFDDAERQVHAIITECAAELEAGTAEGDAARIGALYSAFMDTEAVNRAGAEPLRADLAVIEAATSHEELAHAVGVLDRAGVGGVVGVWVDTDPDDPERYAVNLAQNGISLPDEAYYREDSFAATREAYVTHIAAMLALTCADALPVSPEEAADTVFGLEKNFASGHWDAVASRDEVKTHNPMTMAALAERAPGFAWVRWVEGLGAPKGALERVIVRQPSFAEHMAEVWSSTPLADLKMWLAWRVVGSRAGLLSEDIVQQNFAFWGPVITGSKKLRDRWKRGVSMVESVMGQGVGRIYVERHFPATHRGEVSGIVQNLLEAYRVSIGDLEWMGPQTREKALDKLGKITLKIGYPDTWRDYSALTLTSNDPVGNARAAAAFDVDRELTKSLGPVDRTEWFMSPQTVNAYYNPGMNEIVFPAAILQPPFFTAGADQAANYGGIGAVIGHEIGHAFDDQGSRFDGDGRLADWWTEEDRAEFERRTAALIAQYDAFVPRQLADREDPPHVNGALTVGENIGDLGGLAIAWSAYTLAVGQTRPEIEGLSAEQRFFWGWASSWRTKVRDEDEILRLTVDPHSPAEFRCNGVVRNLDVFYTAFDVTPGDALWLDPAERVSIW